MKSELTASVSNGKVIWDYPGLAVNFFRVYEGKRIVVTITGEQRKRSVRQNRYYWGVPIKLIRLDLLDKGYNDYNDQDVHTFLSCAFFGTREIVNPFTGETTVKPARSTTEVSTKEFNEYIEFILQWAAEKLGIAIPLPNEEWYKIAA